MGKKRKSGLREGDREKTMRKGETGKGREKRGRKENKRWKRKKCVKLQLPENIGLQN